MTWRDNLRESTFRGVPYLYQESERAGGRRLSLNEYPRQDTPYVEDLGRKAREWTLTAYVFGLDYMDRRDALIDALEKQGTGEWLHPREGSVWVQVDSYSLSESTKDGNLATFNVRFIESGKQGLPGAIDNTVHQVTVASKRVRQVVEQSLAENLDVTSGLTLETAVQTIEQASEALAQVNGVIDAAIAPVSQIAARIETIGIQAADLLRSPADLVASMADVQFSLYGAYNDIRSVLRIYDDLDSAFTFPSIAPETTATNTAINANQVQLSIATRAINVVAAAQVVADLTRTVDASSAQSPFESYGEVVALRDRFLTSLDSIGQAGDYSLYDAASALKISINAHLNNHGMRLPRVQYLRVRDPRPLLTIAYQLHGDAGTVDDLRRRNDLAQPIYVPAGQTLEYLQ